MKKIRRLSRRYVARQQKQAKKRVKYLRHHPFVVPVITFLLLFITSTVAFIALGGQTISATDSRVVDLLIDGKAQTVPTRAPTVKDLLARLNVAYNAEDYVNPKPETPIIDDGLKITVRHAKPVTVVDGSRRITVLSAHEQPRLVVQQAGLSLAPEDGIQLDSSVDLASEGLIGQKVVIDRAIPAIINLYGNSISVKTRAKSVEELLGQKGIKPLQGDTIDPSPSTKIVPNIQVFVVRKGKKVVTQEVAIPAPVVTVDDPNLANGSLTVREPGSDGKKLVTYELELQNDKEVGRRVIQEVMASEPVRRVVARGTKVLLSGDKATWLSQSAIPASQYAAADFIIGKESGWRPGAINANRCIGLGQSCGSGLAAACPAWQVDPVCQLNFFNNYANRRYGSWNGAYDFWIANRWW